VSAQNSSFDRNLILVVDDDKDFVETTIALLGKEMPDVKFLRAYDGNMALDLCQNSFPMPGIVILDMMLPKRSGFLVLEKIRRTSRERDLPRVIMVTAHEGARHKAYAEMLGVFDYLRKPFDMAILLKAVREARAAA